ncbi:3'(2'),5'-bisphosphate nucleotidase CysQ [Jiulongibacter sp. NS-SX5]|uniref:3'(2'),5'-bisphosphate nucleotidase CysQ n=1 Tax=Jiulongibacter sp. NS-SX5 TaxID=3463854 RepID=UPI0040591BD9
MTKNYTTEDILAILEKASQAIMDVYHSFDPENDIEIKGDNSPLTRADKKSHECIVSVLEKLTPEIVILSEENTEDIEGRLEKNLLWCIDPLDGTKEFIKKKTDFCINIALLQNGIPIEGYVAVPAKEEIYWAVKGKGAFKQLKNGDKIAIKTRSFEKSSSGLKIAASASHLNEDTSNFINAFDSPELCSMGSALKFLKIAEGEIDIYPRIAPTMEWDTAAPQMILEEAGGKVLHYETLKPLAYNKEDLLNPYFVAFGNGELNW